MALNPLPKRLDDNDPRRKGNETTYQASRGGYQPKPQQPVPGTPKGKR